LTFIFFLVSSYPAALAYDRMQYELIDEMRNFQTVDTNSAYFARWCFSLGILLKRVEVITDEEDDIIESVKRLSANYDFVVTSGGNRFDVS